MFMHIVGILVVFFALAALIWFLPNYLKYGKLGEPPWGVRLPIIRDQLLAVLAATVSSKLLFTLGFYFLGKLAVGVTSALIIYFLWEDVTIWSKHGWALFLKEQKRLLYVLLLFSVIWAFF